MFYTKLQVYIQAKPRVFWLEVLNMPSVNDLLGPVVDHMSVAKIEIEKTHEFSYLVINH